MVLTSGTVLKGNWVVEKKIGAGAFADVFSVSPSVNNSGVDKAIRYVAKVIPLPTGKGKLLKEQTVIVNSLYCKYTYIYNICYELA